MFKNTAILLGFGALLVGAPLSFSWAQTDSELSSFLNLDQEVIQPEVVPPAQEGLQDSSAVPVVVTPEPSSPLELQPVTDVTSNDDALPTVPNTRLSLEDAGLSATDIDGVRTPLLQGLDVEQKTPEELAEEIRQEAFDAAITGLFPMRPEEIKEVLRQYDKTGRAVEEPVFGAPTPQVTVATISLDPGVTPLVIKTATGHITTLSMLDATGAPWPIQDIGWAGDFEVIEPEEGGHIVRITPMSIAAYGNMSIRLLKLKTPVTITLATSKDEVQYRVDARIAEFGPQSAPQIIEGGSERVAGNDLLMAVLDGVPPTGAVRLDVGGVDGRTTAYRINEITYVRTPLSLLSPGWQQSVSSADGMNVYALTDTPVLLLSDRGRFTRASLKTGKDVLDE